MITSSAAARAAITSDRLGMLAIGFVQMIQQALIAPARMSWNIATAPSLPPAARVPGGIFHSASAKARSSASSALRWPGRPGPIYPISRPPIALGCPVSENGPLPGRQILPVARCRLHSALVLKVPWVLWLRPMVQQLIHSPAAPIHSAAVRMSFASSPVAAATISGVYPARNAGIASHPSVWRAMKSASVLPFACSRCSRPLSKARSVPARS